MVIRGRPPGAVIYWHTVKERGGYDEEVVAIYADKRQIGIGVWDNWISI